MIKKIAAILILLLAALPARADDYVKPTWPDLARTLVRFNALALSDDAVIDEYAAIAECDLYTAAYRDDFKWNKVRAAIRESLWQHTSTFPVTYRYTTELQLDRYDFDNKLFRFAKGSILRGVNTFALYTVEGSPCNGVRINAFPSAYRVVLNAPLALEGLPLDAKAGEALLHEMKESGNATRVVTANFNVRIVYIAHLYKGMNEQEPAANSEYFQNSMGGGRALRLDAHLDSIDFFEDAEMKKPIYHYQP